MASSGSGICFKRSFTAWQCKSWPSTSLVMIGTWLGPDSRRNAAGRRRWKQRCFSLVQVSPRARSLSLSMQGREILTMCTREKKGRRLGKSIATGMLAAAVALVRPNSQQAIFSTSQRIAGYLGEICHQNILYVDKTCIYRKTEELYARANSPPSSIELRFGADDVRRIYYYPANPTIDQISSSYRYTLLPPLLSSRVLLGDPSYRTSSLGGREMPQIDSAHVGDML